MKFCNCSTPHLDQYSCLKTQNEAFEVFNQVMFDTGYMRATLELIIDPNFGHHLTNDQFEGLREYIQSMNDVSPWLPKMSKVDNSWGPLSATEVSMRAECFQVDARKELLKIQKSVAAALYPFLFQGGKNEPTG